MTRSQLRALAAGSVPSYINVGIRHVVGMTMRAMGCAAALNKGLRSIHIQPVANCLQVIGINAALVSAQMVNFAPSRYWPSMKLVAKTVNPDALPRADLESAISSRFVASPEPTRSQLRTVDWQRASLIDPSPKPLNCGSAGSSVPRRFDDGGIAPFVPAVVVHLAPIPRSHWASATFNRAETNGSVRSHREPHLSGVMRTGVTASRPPYFTTYSMLGQGHSLKVLA